jgi:hypothetical protein
VRYLLNLPNDMSVYESKPGDFDRALRDHIDMWLGDNWSIQPIELGSDLQIALDDAL